MSTSEKYFADMTAVVQQLAASCADTLASGKRAVVICPNGRVQHFVKTRLAKKSAASVGVQVCTINSWLQDNWQLYQQKRKPINQTLRQTLILKLINEQPDEPKASPYVGYVTALGELATQGLDIICNQAAEIISKKAYKDGAPITITERELAFIKVLQDYRNVIDQLGLIEVSQMVAELIADDSFVKTLNDFEFYFVCFDGFKQYEKLLLTELNNRANEIYIFSESRESVQRPKNAPKFIAPTGPEALNKAIVDVISDNEKPGEASTVVVAMADPYDTFFGTYSELLRRGYDVTINCKIRICSTNFGKALITLLKMAYTYSDVITQAQLVAYAKDFVVSSFSGVPYSKAVELCNKWDAAREITRQQIFEDMADQCQVFVGSKQNSFNKIALLGACIEKNSIGTMARVMIDQQFGSVENNLLSREICADLVKLFEAIVPIGFSIGDLIDILEIFDFNLNNSFSANVNKGAGSAQATVKFMSTKNASELEPGTADLLIVPDMDAATYSVKNPEGAAPTLLSLFNIANEADVLTSHRRMITRLLQVAKTTYIGRTLVDFDQKPTYDSVMLNQTISALGAKDLEDALEKFGGISPTEQAVTANALAGQKIKISGRQPFANTERLSGEQFKSFKQNLLARNFSASSLELFLRCPYRWYSERILHLNTPSTGVGALETGSFAHKVLKDFYDSFLTDARPRVTDDNLQEAHELLDNTIEIDLEFEKNAAFIDNPYVPTTPTELAMHKVLVANLHNVIARDAKFMPQFFPKYFEYKFGYNQDVYYAGVKIKGSIDRIDVNPSGDALIIDYKGSAAAKYGINQINIDVQGHKICLPESIQALVYAQVARRLLGLNPVGAIYRGYGKDCGSATKPGAAGAVSAMLGVTRDKLDFINLNAAEVPNGAEDKRLNDSKEEISDFVPLNLSSTNFLELLDAVEANIQACLQCFDETNISPCNVCGCDFCEIINCDMRK